MNRHGFTIVELIITITVMGILLILGVANLRGSQIPARDSTRKTDIDAISQNLEIFYRTGTDSSTTLGRYPSTTELIGQETVTLRDIDPKVLSAPGVTGSSLLAATNNTATTAGIAPQPTINTYVYQPLQADGSLCTSGAQECRKFNLYYRLEADSLVYSLTSKNQ